MQTRLNRRVLLVQDAKGRTVEFRVTKHGPSLVSEGLADSFLEKVIRRFERFIGGWECAPERLEDLEDLAKSSSRFEVLLAKLA